MAISKKLSRMQMHLNKNTMRNSFIPVKMALWTALAGLMTLSILNRFSLLTLAGLACLIAALGYWLFSHRGELAKKYQVAEANAAVPGPYDKAIYGQHKPTLRNVAPGMALLGLSGFYFAYEAAHGEAPGRLVKLVHYFFGVPGVVMFWSFLGTFLLAKGLEAMIGSRTKA